RPFWRSSPRGKAPITGMWCTPSRRRWRCCVASWSAATSASPSIRRPRPARWCHCDDPFLKQEPTMSEVNDTVPHSQLDACGLFCPEPVMLLHNRIRDMAVEEVVEVIATDPSTTRDIPKFCLFLGHELLAQSESEGQYRYLIRKK